MNEPLVQLECNCLVPWTDGAGQHAPGCAVFANDRSVCCFAPIRWQIDYGEGTGHNVCTSCDMKCRVIESVPAL